MAASQLTEDLLEEILARVPTSSLIKFKSVSKQWLRSITGNPFAVRQHQLQTLSRSSSGSYSFFLIRITQDKFCKNFITPISISLGRGDAHVLPNIVFPHNVDFIPVEEERPQMHALFPAGYGIYCIFEFLTPTVLLWNPSTKQTNVLPPSPYHHFHRNHHCRFGTVDYKDGEFSCKVGRVASYLAPPTLWWKFNFSLELYSSKTKSWKWIPNVYSVDYLRYGNSSCANFNGKAHWVISSCREIMHIFSFDYETEVFGMIKAPSPPKDGGYYDERKRIVTLFDDKFLCLVLSRTKDGERYLDIWVMREYGVEDSWTKEFTVKLVPKDIELLGFSSKTRCVFLHNFGHSPAQLLLYDCRSSKFKQCHLGHEGVYEYMQMVEHVESLASILE